MLGLLLSIASSPGATFVVNKTADSGAGSLRQAITNANATATLDTINFNIPGTGVQTITPATPLPVISSPVTINGYSQPGSSPNTLAVGNNAVLRIQLNGASAGVGVHGLQITAGSSTVRGLVINRFSGSAIVFGEGTNGGNVVQGNFIGTDPTGTIGRGNGRGVFLFSSPNNRIGGTTPAARNLISGNTNAGIDTFMSSGNIIEGNYFGTTKSGGAVIGGTPGRTGIFLAPISDGNRIGGTSTGARNVISGHQASAVFLQGTVANIVEGNYIGSDATGKKVLGNALDQQSGCAVCVTGNRNPFGTGGGPATDNRIGGTIPAAANVIGGYQGGGAAVFLGGSSVGDSRRANSNLVQGNFIGVGSDGATALPNRGIGIHVQDGDDNIVGGVVVGGGNVVTNSKVGPFNPGTGVTVSSGVRNQILGNSIYKNDQLGIDLAANGTITPNDQDDPDTGANDLQNFPIITAAAISGGNVTLTGHLNSTPNTIFRLEFFGGAEAHSSGYGEGKTFLGSGSVTTDANGNAEFNSGFAVPPGTRSFAVTATDTLGNTSEFSPAFRPSLLNISTRMRVLPGDDALIAGFIITGADSKRVIIRGMGPSISGAGSETLVDPILELNIPGSASETNDNWRDTQEEEIEATGIPPGDNAESAIVATLAPGVYTAILREKNNVPGIGLIEVFDLDQAAGAELANISTRGFVDTGDNVMIGGFIIGPAEIGTTEVVVRALGPSLQDAGVPNPLQDPTLQLFDGNGTPMRTNDNWKSHQRAQLVATGIQPRNDAEAAMIVDLPAGNYTAIVRGKDNSTGVGLVEVYNIQ